MSHFFFSLFYTHDNGGRLVFALLLILEHGVEWKRDTSLFVFGPNSLGLLKVGLLVGIILLAWDE
jgi:hypothetical protein